MTGMLDRISSASGNYLLIAFLLYCVAFLLYVIAITGKRWGGTDPDTHRRRWGRLAFLITVLGFAGHILFFITRWYVAKRIPTSNMYEFMTFLAMMIILAFLVIYALYKLPVVGAFALPLTIVILAYASVFPKEITPLIPSLQSHWLKIHVTLAALGEAFFAVGFAAGLMYILRTLDYGNREKSGRREQHWTEFTLYVILIIIGFVATVFSFQAGGYRAVFEVTVEANPGAGIEEAYTDYSEYVLPPIFAPHDAKLVEMTPFLGMERPLFETPAWMKGRDAGRKWNTVIWSIMAGTLLYGIFRLIARRPLGSVIKPALSGLDPDDLDEISYRAIAIGFPIFTLGALIFAMIWAQEAWGRFWGWDPKETWALITWLFYSVYLHLRLARIWQGKKSAWLAVIGFLIVMFTLVGVNLVIAGLHSYAGV